MLSVPMCSKHLLIPLLLLGVQVAGVLYYFPFQGGTETLPMEDSTSFDPGDSTVDLTQGERGGTQQNATQNGQPPEGGADQNTMCVTPINMRRVLLPRLPRNGVSRITLNGPQFLGDR